MGSVTESLAWAARLGAQACCVVWVAGLVAPALAQEKPDALLRVRVEAGQNEPNLRHFEPALRPCMGIRGGPALPNLPKYSGHDVRLLASAALEPSRLNSHGYRQGLAWREPDKALFLVFIGGMDGAMHLFGPVQRDWTCIRAADLPGPTPDAAAP